MIDIKLCKNCKHYKIIPPEYYSSYLGRDEAYKCSRNLNEIPLDLVTGLFGIIGEYLNCYDERAKISATPNRCGEAGKYFEHK